MSDRFEDESRQRMPTEGVRILGAEEAQAALGATRAPDEPAAARSGAADDDATEDTELELDLTPPDGPNVGTGSPTRARRGPRPRRTTSPSSRISRRVRSRRSRTGPNRRPARCRRSSSTPTRPMPRSSRGGAPAASPRFRAEGSDWADADFSEDALTDSTTHVGELAEASIVDDDESFERDLAERRRRTPRGRAARTMVTTPPAATATAAAATATPPGAARPLLRYGLRRPPSVGTDGGPRPADRHRDRRSGRGRRAHLLHAGHVLDRPARRRDRRARNPRVHRADCRRAASAPRRRSRSSVPCCCRSRRASSARPRIPCSSA